MIRVEKTVLYAIFRGDTPDGLAAIDEGLKREGISFSCRFGHLVNYILISLDQGEGSDALDKAAHIQDLILEHSQKEDE